MLYFTVIICYILLLYKVLIVIRILHNKIIYNNQTYYQLYSSEKLKKTNQIIKITELPGNLTNKSVMSENKRNFFQNYSLLDKETR